MALFTKTTTSSSSSSSNDKPQNRLFINIGIPVEIEGKEQFINIPLALTADYLPKALDTIKSKISDKTPQDILQILEGKITLGEAVKEVFNTLEDGQSITQDDIDPNNEEFGFLSRLKVQFYKQPEKETVDTGNAKQIVRNKLFGKE